MLFTEGQISEEYLRLFQKCMMELFTKVVTGDKPLTVSAKNIHRRRLIGF